MAMIDIAMLGKTLLLLWIANGAPILAARLLGKHWATPVDFGYQLWDRHPLFGTSKTWRGMLSALLLTTPAAMLLGFDLDWAFLIGALAMAGDLCSSFIKRRLGMAPSERARFLDQVPESILPLLALCGHGYISWSGVIIVTLLFVLTDMLFSLILYRLRIRRRPY